MRAVKLGTSRSRARTWGLIGTLLVTVITVAGCRTTQTTKAVADHGPGFDRGLHAQLPEDIRRRGVLVVGTDPSYAPMSSYGENGRTIVGMEPDLAKDLGEVLGLKVKMKDVPFATILDQVGTDKFDIALSAMTDTPERAEKVDFLDYFRAGTAILVQRDNPHRIASLGDLCGKRVAVESGTVQVDLLAAQQGPCGARPIEVLQFSSNSDALLRLRTGRAAAVLADLPPAALLTRSPRTRQFYELASDKQYDPGYYGLAVSKEDPQLRSALLQAMHELQGDGEYTKVLRRWGLEAGAVPEVLVNSGRG